MIHTPQYPSPPPRVVVTEGHVPEPLAQLELPERLERKERRQARAHGWIDTFSTRRVPDDVLTERVVIAHSRCQERETAIIRWAIQATHQVRVQITALGPQEAGSPPAASVPAEPTSRSDTDAARWAQARRAQEVELAAYRSQVRAAEQSQAARRELEADLLHIARASEAAIQRWITHTNTIVALYTRSRRGLFSRNASGIASIPAYARFTSPLTVTGVHHEHA